MVKHYNVPKKEGPDIFDHPTCETIFQLKELVVPPKNYSDFLIDSIDTFVDILKQHHGVSDIESIAEKSAAKILEANPEARGEDDFIIFGVLSMPVSLHFSARLNFLKPETNNKIQGEVYQSKEFTQDFFYPYGDCHDIPFGNFREEIPSYLRTLQEKLKVYYPTGKIPDGLSRSNFKEDDDIHKFIDGFRFTLQLKSLPTDHLSIYITLREYGAVYLGKIEHFTIPGISIKTETSGGTLVLPKKVTKTLGDVVHKHYRELGHIEHRQSYIESPYK